MEKTGSGLRGLEWDQSRGGGMGGGGRATQPVKGLQAGGAEGSEDGARAGVSLTGWHASSQVQA